MGAGERAAWRGINRGWGRKVGERREGEGAERGEGDVTVEGFDDADGVVEGGEFGGDVGDWFLGRRKSSAYRGGKKEKRKKGRKRKKTPRPFFQAEKVKRYKSITSFSRKPPPPGPNILQS